MDKAHCRIKYKSVDHISGFMIRVFHIGLFLRRDTGGNQFKTDTASEKNGVNRKMKTVDLEC